MIIVPKVAMKMMESHAELSWRLKNAKAWIFDGDDTFWSGNVVFQYAKMRLSARLHETSIFRPSTYSNLLRCGLDMREYLRAKEVDAKRQETGDGEGIRIFYNALVRDGHVTKEDMSTFAMDYFNTHRIGSVKAVLNGMKNYQTPIFLSTRGGSTMANVASIRFGFEAVVSNVDLFENGVLVGVVITVPNGEIKLARTFDMLSERGIRLGESAVFGNDLADIPLMCEVRAYGGVSIAPPDAIRAVNEIAMFHLQK